MANQAIHPDVNREDSHIDFEQWSTHISDAPDDDMVWTADKVITALGEQKSVASESRSESPLQAEGKELHRAKPRPDDNPLNRHTSDRFQPSTTLHFPITSATPPIDNCSMGEKDCDQDLDTEGLLEDEPRVPKYELRAAARLPKKIFRSWMDRDDSGNFDPNTKPQAAKPRLKRARLEERKDPGEQCDSGNEADAESGGRTPKKPRILSWEAGRRAGDVLLVELKPMSEAVKVKLREIPHGESRPLDEVKDIAAQAPGVSSTNLSDGRKLRNRPSRATCHSASDFSNYDHLMRLGLPADLTGHPIARGCWNCIKAGVQCPLVGYDDVYPCDYCRNDNTDCELVTTPKCKRPCQGCINSRKTCSYTHSIDHSQPCTLCVEKGFKCVAGPAQDTMGNRISYNRNYERYPTAFKRVKRRFAPSCVQCREDDRTCSFSCGSKKPPCTACDMNGWSCITEGSITIDEAKLIIAEERKPEPTDNAESTNELTQETVHKNSTVGLAKTITTKLCHPVEFMCEDSSGGARPCDFCSTPNYSILGLGSKEVEVIDLQGGAGYEEISGGHRREGIDPTRLCVSCTFSRMRICSCEKHELRRIPGVNVLTLDTDGAIDRMFTNDTAMKRDRWCALCPQLAQYECSAAQSMGDAMAAAGCGLLGCGLLLCEPCANFLSGFDGDLQALVQNMKDEATEERPLGLRADFELLRRDGLLMRHVLQ